MSGQIHTLAFTVNAASSRKRMRNGKTHLVAPSVLITHGVHEGSGGPIYYPDTELKPLAPLYNNVALVLSHPTDDKGQPITVNTAGILEKSGLGLVDNSKWSSDRIRAENWFDEEKSAAVDSRVVEALKAGRPFEISTGLIMDIEPKSGVYNGKSYIGVARNIKPDHLAVLMDAKGACSIEDGCGCLVANEASFRRIMYAITDATEKKFGYRFYVRDVYAGFFVYTDGNGKLFRQSYAMNGDTASIGDGDPVPVEWVTEYQTLDGEFVGNCTCAALKDKEIDVDKNALINAIIGNGTGAWVESDRKVLEGFDEGKLKKLMPAPAPMLNPMPAPPVVNQAVTLDQLLAAASPEVRGLVKRMEADAKAAKATVVANIRANPKNRFSEEFLNTKDLEELQHLAELAGAPQQVMNYAPAGGVQMFNNGGGANGGVPALTPLVPPDVITAA